MDRQVVRYEGPPSRVGLFAQYLEEEGLEVDYRPPIERKGLGEPATIVLIYASMKVVDAVTEVAQDALKAAIRRAIARWRERGHGGDAELEE